MKKIKISDNPELQQQILFLNKKGYNTVYISSLIGCNQSTIERFLKKRGVKTNPTGLNITITWDEIEEIVDMYNRGYVAKEIQEKINCNICENTIIKIVKKYGESKKCRPRGAIAAPLNENYFDIIDTRSKAYILGVIFADGSIVNNKGHNRLSIEIHNKDVELLKFIKNELEYEGLIHFRKDKPHAYLNISSDKLCLKLEDYGIIRNKTLIATPNIKNIPRHLQPDYVRGLIDGDGCVFKSGYLSYVGNNMSINEMSNYFQEITGNPGNIYHYGNSNAYTVMLTDKKSCAKIYRQIYHDEPFCLSRKKERAYQLIPC